MTRDDNEIEEHILNIIQNNDIAEQIDLQTMLKERGYQIPQATLSRRLKKLKIAKIAGFYKIIDLNIPNLPLVLNLQVSDFGLIILHTHPGNANSLAFYIDQKYVSYKPKQAHQQKSSGILGTIAGDDTVLLIIKSKSDLNNVLSLLNMDFPYLNL